MSVIIRIHESILNYISKRWKIEYAKKRDFTFKVTKGRPRNSRKNVI